MFLFLAFLECLYSMKFTKLKKWQSETYNGIELQLKGFNQRNKVFIQAEWDVIQKMTCH